MGWGARVENTTLHGDTYRQRVPGGKEEEMDREPLLTHPVTGEGQVGEPL